MQLPPASFAAMGLLPLLAGSGTRDFQLEAAGQRAQACAHVHAGAAAAHMLPSSPLPQSQSLWVTATQLDTWDLSTGLQKSNAFMPLPCGQSSPVTSAPIIWTVCPHLPLKPPVREEREKRKEGGGSAEKLSPNGQDILNCPQQCEG
jgi:hypothetical protein